MTVNVTKPAINLRSELTRLKAPAIIQPQRFQTFWFENLVENGTFDADTDWTKGADWTISGGEASKAGVSANDLEQDASLVEGLNYLVKFDYNRTDGLIYVRVGDDTNNSPSVGTGAGSVEEAYTALGSENFQISGNAAATFTVDNVSVYEADPSDDAPWYRMPLGWKPFQVFEDGSLIREGSTQDYEVIFDGYTYFVKPSVAPGVSTETQVVGEAV